MSNVHLFKIFSKTWITRIVSRGTSFAESWVYWFPQGAKSAEEGWKEYVVNLAEAVWISTSTCAADLYARELLLASCLNWFRISYFYLNQTEHLHWSFWLTLFGLFCNTLDWGVFIERYFFRSLKVKLGWICSVAHSWALNYSGKAGEQNNLRML